jgi:hypothetical protein
VLLVAGSARAEPSHVVVVAGDSSILEPAVPLPFSHARLRFEPTGDRGYATALLPGSTIEPRGKLLRFAGGESSPTRIALIRPITLYGVPYRDLYVYPQGVVTLGEPLAAGVHASAASTGALAPDLLSGPAVVAPFWNELVPSRPIPGGGVFVAQWEGSTSVAWIGIPSVRPADAPNTFRIVFHPDGAIDLEYGPMSSGWGVVGLAPEASGRAGIASVDFAREADVPPDAAALAIYRDLPLLNEIALARRVYEQVPDRFEFMTVFSTVPIDGPHLVYSSSVKNGDRGIGLPIFDQSGLLGAKRLEHLVVMNDLAFWDEEPSGRPRAQAYAFAESTLAVLAHETGHRWLAHLDGDLCSGDGHWSYFLENGASFMGGHRLRENPDGSFTSIGALQGFAPLDLYLMGLLPPAEVEPFYVVDHPHGFTTEAGAPIAPPRPGSRPEVGVTFRGERREHSIHGVVARLGPRVPEAETSRSFHMVFVLVVPQGAEASAAELAKVDRARRAFGPFFRQATHGRARMWTRVPAAAPVLRTEPDPLLVAGVPRVLGARLQRSGDGRELMAVDFADYDGDVAALEVSTDVTQDLEPARLEVDGENHGSRRGTITIALRDLPREASELRIALVDELGQRSSVYAWRVAAGEATAAAP